MKQEPGSTSRLLLFSTVQLRKQRIVDAFNAYHPGEQLLAYTSFADLAYTFSGVSAVTVLFDVQGTEEEARAYISILRNLNSQAKLLGLHSGHETRLLDSFFDGSVSIENLEAGQWPGQPC